MSSGRSRSGCAPAARRIRASSRRGRACETCWRETASRSTRWGSVLRRWALIYATGGLPWVGIGRPRDGLAPPRRWDERVELAPAVTACRAGDWCVVVARKPSALAHGALLDGSELDLPREIGKGTFQLRGVERRYVTLEGE